MKTTDWLSTQKEPKIVQLVPKVERVVQAYEIYKNRLTKVSETLGQYLEKVEANGEVG